MTNVQFRIPNNEQLLAVAVTEFIETEFNQLAHFTSENTENVTHKDSGLLDIAWQLVVLVATIEGSLQFSERVKRMERVKKLLSVIKSSGKSVYLKISDNKSVDLSEKSVDETMDLLEKDTGNDND